MSTSNRLLSNKNNALHTFPEPVFVDLLRSPGIDSQPGGPVRQPYLLYRSAKLQASGIDFSESIPGLLKRLQIRALVTR
jgi:hypothetical protein